MLINNKKADIPITILVLGILAVCTLAIFSFVSSEKKISESFAGIGAIETLLSTEEQIKFYEGVGKSSDEIVKIFNGEVKYDEKERVYVLSKKIFGNSKEIIFSVNYKLRQGK